MALIDIAQRPLRSLALVFTAWKAFLLAIAIGAAVGPDYDTSTSLFFERVYDRRDGQVPLLAQRLTRWDALYYMHTARDGYLFEQEWAFASGLPILVSLLRRVLDIIGLRTDAIVLPIFAIGVAHVTHLGSTIILYRLTQLLSRNQRLAFFSAVLHIISPAGVFLSSPYSESPFSFLSFAGIWVFALGLRHERTTWGRSINITTSGLLIGAATFFRSNGLSYGLLFAVEALTCALLTYKKPSLSHLFTLVAPIIGGLAVASGSVIPQAIAWQKFCGDGPLRTWCHHMPPSIYTFVQEHYWYDNLSIPCRRHHHSGTNKRRCRNQGFLRYWTPNQIPLFLLAGPVLALLIMSGVGILREPASCLSSSLHERHAVFARVLAVTQLSVAILTITNFHVQMVTRMASGYLVWYWWVASHLLGNKKTTVGSVVPIFMVMYASIQAALYASFLPPA
jgi:phosphatidylinositol glycan class V